MAQPLGHLGQRQADLAHALELGPIRHVTRDRSAPIRFNADMTTLRAGVDLGGTKVQTVVVDERFSVLGQMRLPTPTKGGPQKVADTIAETIRGACTEAEAEPTDLASIGVGSPGDVDDENGIVTSARNSPAGRAPSRSAA